MVLSYICLRSQARDRMTTLRGPCRLPSGHRPKNSEITAIQDYCEANSEIKCLSTTKPNRKGMEQLPVGKWKHTNISTYAPPSDGGLPRSFIGKARTQYNRTRGLMVTIYNRDGSSAADCWVAASPVNKCLPLGYGAVHTWLSQPTPCQAGSNFPSHTRCLTDGRVHSRTCTTIDPVGAEQRTPVCLTLLLCAFLALPASLKQCSSWAGPQAHGPWAGPPMGLGCTGTFKKRMGFGWGWA